jgi:hypothetical protein
MGVTRFGLQIPSFTYPGEEPNGYSARSPPALIRPRSSA